MIPLKYNLRSLRVRKTTSVAAAGGVALVVWVFSSALMLSKGLESTLGRSGSPDVAIVLRKGSAAELESGIEVPNIGMVLASSDVRRRRDGQPDGVGEAVVVAMLDKLGTDGMSNVEIRGVTDDVYSFRPEVRIVEGRKARPGADEAVIGRAIRGRFRGLDIGQSFEMRKNLRLKIVGVFEAAGSSLESEVWADRDTVAASFGHQGVIQSVRVRLRSPARMRSFQHAIESERRLGLEVFSEPHYYEKQSEGTSIFISAIGLIIAVFTSIAAMIGAMITMYAAVSQRSREIGTMRALGFHRWQILVSFVIESILLSLLGGAIGAVASLAMGSVHFSIVNFASWSEIVFRFQPTVGILLSAMGFAAFMGVLGGFLPAVRAARSTILQALRG
jgi:putative ABC transport system permease protein